MRSAAVRTVLSAWSWLTLGLSVIVIVPLVAVVRLATAFTDPGRYKAGRVFRQIPVVHQKLNPLWKFRVSGKIPSDPRRPYVVVANHESFVDILLLSHLPFEMKWMSKSDFFRYPLIGWAMRMAGDIKLERTDAKGGALALAESRDRLDKKVSVMIFAEGTRSPDGELQQFRDGAFRLAIQAGVPILPVAVIGTRDALVKHDWRFGVTDAEARVLEPISTEGLTKHDVPALRERTRDAIADALATMRAERAGTRSPV
jgi:1-acyl-sn-glycerol-3-phosphate acyltransferase